MAELSADGTAREIAKQRIFAVAPLPSESIGTSKSLKSRPIPLVSVRNQFDLLMEVELDGNQAGHRNRFLVRNQFRLPVGWEAIELFPPFQTDKWSPDFAQIWAGK